MIAYFEDGVNSGKIKYIDGFICYVEKIEKFYNDNLKIDFNYMNGVITPSIKLKYLIIDKLLYLLFLFYKIYNYMSNIAVLMTQK